MTFVIGIVFWCFRSTEKIKKKKVNIYKSFRVVVLHFSVVVPWSFLVVLGRSEGLEANHT